jgi:hypothetical protein
MSSAPSNGKKLIWLTPLAGGMSPALYYSIHGMFDPQVVDLFAAFAVWVIRDGVIAYAFALPALLIGRRLGVRNAFAFWLIAAMTGARMGYVLANPVDYAWTPSEQDFAHGPYWSRLAVHMALTGLTGIAFAALSRRYLAASDGSKVGSKPDSNVSEP